MANSIVPVAAVMLGVEGMSEDEGRANANLIEEAPDLLAALTALLKVLGGDRSALPECVAARAAIARVRGEAS